MREEDGGAIALHPDIEPETVALRRCHERRTPRGVERAQQLILRVAQVDPRPLVPKQPITK